MTTNQANQPSQANRPNQAQPDPDRLLRSALQRAANGHPVFPCIPNTKRPLTEHGLLDATTDQAQIRAWWKRTPTANLAVPTGTSSFDVLDVDVRETSSGYPAFNRLIRAGLVEGYSHVITTPSGGMHAYFTGTDQTSSRIPGAKLDFKASGGYVLAPPSVLHGRAYELVRRTEGPHKALDWSAVRDFLTPEQAALPPLTQQQAPLRIPQIGIEPLVSFVAHLPEGQRNTGTFWAACRAAERGYTDLKPIVDAAIQAGLPRREALRTVSSAIRRTSGPPPPTHPPRASPTPAPPRRGR